MWALEHEMRSALSFSVISEHENCVYRHSLKFSMLLDVRDLPSFSMLSTVNMKTLYTVNCSWWTRELCTVYCSRCCLMFWTCLLFRHNQQWKAKLCVHLVGQLACSMYSQGENPVDGQWRFNKAYQRVSGVKKNNLKISVALKYSHHSTLNL